MKLLKPLAAFLLFIWSLQQANAQNIVAGAEITYKCTSTPGIFEVHLIVYRTCDVAPLCVGSCGTSCYQTIKVMGVDGAFSTTLFDSITMSLVLVRDVNNNPECKNAKNTCTNMGCVSTGTYAPGYERYEFIGFVNLGPTSNIPSGSCNTRLVWDNGIRDSRVQTITSSQPFYIDAVVNRCFSVSPCNSSPEIYNDAIVAVCEGENVIYNNGMADNDFDSLSFSFTPALAAVNSPITYIPPYDFNRPMPYSGNPDADFPGGIHCDSQTGDVYFTPRNTSGPNFVGVIAIACKQWKTINGKPQVIGITRRDFDMTVLSNCPPNNTPVLSTFPSNTHPNLTTTKMNWEVCTNQQLCFTITAKDTDFLPPTISDTTYLSWNRALAIYGATFLPTYNPSQRKINGPREDSYQFCWTPDDSLANNNPYYFTIKGKDNRCPNAGTVTKAFAIKVNKGSVINDAISLLNSDSGCGRFYFTAVHTNPLANTFLRFIDIGEYPNDPSFSKGSITYPYHQYISHEFKSAGTYTIRYRAYDTVNANGCNPFKSVLNTVNNTYINTTQETITAEAATCSYSTNGSIKVKAISGLSPFLYAVDTGIFSTDTMFTNKAPGKYIVRIKDNAGCVKVIPNIEVKSIPRVFTAGTLHSDKTEFYAGDTVSYLVWLNDFATSAVKWNITNGTPLTAPGTDHIMVRWNHGPASIQVIGSNKGCFDTITQNMTVTNVGIQELKAELGLSVFPNPTQNTLTISMQKLPQQNQLYLYDLQGKLILQQEIKLTQQLHLQELPKGVYMLRVGDWHGKVVRE